MPRTIIALVTGGRKNINLANAPQPANFQISNSGIIPIPMFNWGILDSVLDQKVWNDHGVLFIITVIFPGKATRNNGVIEVRQEESHGSLSAVLSH